MTIHYFSNSENFLRLRCVSPFGIMCHTCLRDVKNIHASGKSVEVQRINRAVDKIRVEVNRPYQELMQTDGYVTAENSKCLSWHQCQAENLAEVV